MRIGQHDTHSAADTLPLMEGADLAGLVDDIKAHGLREPIVLWRAEKCDLILDGRNRYRACIAAKVEPKFRNFDPMVEGSPVDFVISENLARRDLDAWDRAATAQRLVALINREGKKRAKAGPRLPGVTLETEAMAKTVTDDGVPELVEALDARVIDLPSAAAVAGLEPELQRRAVEKLTADAAKPARVVRARQTHESTTYEGGELSPTMRAALTTMCRIAEKSVHAEAGRGAQFVREVFGLGKS